MTGEMGVEGTTLAGRYRLERLLAEGGMGQVWGARHLTLDIPVAVKLMSGAATLRSTLRSRFELEAKAIAQLRSPHIVQIFDYGTEHETPYIVMELLSGSDLLSLIPQRPRWPLSEIADVVTQVGKGLAAAHERGIIHRDIKPGNVFLSRVGPDTVIKLLDFGIAKWMASEQNLTETGAVLGSPYYMAPEQVRGETLDFRADLWALSVVAYRLATGGLPFEGRDALEVAESVMVGTWKPVPASTPRADDLQRFFSRAFTQNREKRFGSAAELTQAFVAISGPPAPAWTGEQRRSPGENTVTMLRPWLSKKATTDDEDVSLTDVGHAVVPSADTEDEVLTNRVARKAAEGTTERMRQAPPDELSAQLAELGVAPAANVPFRPPEPSVPQMQQQLDRLSYPDPRLSQPGVSQQIWAPGSEVDLDSLATAKIQTKPAVQLSTAKIQMKPDVPRSLEDTTWPSVQRKRPSAVIISLSLCGLLVFAIAVWIFVNVGSTKEAETEGAASSAPALHK